MFRTKGYDKKRIILDTPKTVCKSDVKESEKTVLEEPMKVNDGREILTEEVTADVSEEPKKKSGKRSKKLTE